MSYIVTFNSPVAFDAALAAVTQDLSAMGLPAPEAYPRLTVDNASRTLTFTGSIMELGALFGNARHSATAAHIPFDTFAPLPEEFERVAKERGIEGVTIQRAEGDFLTSYKQKREEAVAFFTQTPIPLKPAPAMDTADGDWQHRVGNNLNIAVNEAHGDQAHLRLLIERMPQLAGKGYALQLEHFFKDQQPFLDAYMQSPPGTPMPPELAAYVDRFIDPRVNGTEQKASAGAHVYSARELLETAKRHGVRPIAIEDEEALSSRTFAMANRTDHISVDNDAYGMSDRMLMMNHNVAKLAADWRQNPAHGGTVSLAGASHGEDFSVPDAPWKSRLPTVPGLGSILQSPTFFPIDPDNVSKLHVAAQDHLNQQGALPWWLSPSSPHFTSSHTVTLDAQGKAHPADLYPLQPESFSCSPVEDRDLGTLSSPRSFTERCTSTPNPARTR